MEIKAERLLSLDALRGLTILLMLLVNNMALDVATPIILTHASWNAGIYLADLVFPWFLFCVGVAIPFSYSSFKKKGMSEWRYDLRILARTLTLFLIGLLLDSSIAGRPIFTLGVLQLIALAYLVGVFLYDLPLLRRLIVAGALLILYWAAIKFIPIPGAGPGLFEQDLNLIRHINLNYLARFNLSGLPSVIPTAALVMIGTAIGDLLRRADKSHGWKLLALFISGAILAGLGLLWNFHLPFNKPVWTPAYIVFTAGLATLALCLLYLTIDMFKWGRQWSYPLLVFGSNAILAYVAPILVKVLILQQWQVGNISLQQWLLNFSINNFGRITGGWTYTLAYIFVWWLVLWQLYRKKLFLRV